MVAVGVRSAVGAAAFVLVAVVPPEAHAETLYSALAHAYQNNPQLNAERAKVRATDEGVPQALSGYRPRVSLSATAGAQFQQVTTKTPSPIPGGPPTYTYMDGFRTPGSYGITGTQTIYNGHQTANRTRAAESQVSAAREALRVMEQTVLLNAATVYMDVLRDSALVELQRSNVKVLTETLRQTTDRFNVGEVTRTDVAQAQAQVAAGRSSLLSAESALTTSRANYRRLIGTEPASLTPGMPVDRYSPRTLAAAVAQGLVQNPNVTAAMYGIDVAHLQVKIAEGALYPTVTLQGSVTRTYWQSLTTAEVVTSSVLGQITVPIYQGGTEYALIRQSKKTLTQQRLTMEQTRDQIRATVVQAWGQHAAAKAQIESAQAQVAASETALNGVREEARVGQRTTLDVLNAQQALVNARAALVTAQHDRVVASYSLLSAVGGLAPQVLRLPTPVYDPMVHYQQVRDSWIGVRAPDGK